MDGLEADTEFVKRLVAHTGKSASKIAATAGLAATTLTRPLKGAADTRISQPTFDKLRAAFPSFPDWVEDADLPTIDGDRDYLRIPVLPSYAGMGGSGSGEGDHETGMVPRRLVEDELRAKPSDLLLIEARGDSMAPDFHHGDQILIDMRDRNPIQPGPFALRDDDGYVIKLVERMPGRKGTYRVFSVNDRYSAYEVEENENTIMGRPVWFARRL